jgi:hypothetical protein
MSTDKPRITRRLCESGILPQPSLHGDCPEVSTVDATLDGVPVSLCQECHAHFAPILDAVVIGPRSYRIVSSNFAVEATIRAGKHAKGIALIMAAAGCKADPGVSYAVLGGRDKDPIVTYIADPEDGDARATVRKRKRAAHK